MIPTINSLFSSALYSMLCAAHLSAHCAPEVFDANVLT